MILTVTPGINLSTVSGPISKAQLNQLGQPTVALLAGSVVAADTNFSSLRITDGVYPFLQLTNNSAPTDKKRLRAYVDTSGTVGLARVNDAENVGTSLVGVSVDNRISLGPNGAYNAWVNATSPSLATPAGSTVDMFRWDGANGNLCSLRLLQARNSTGGSWETATTRLQYYTDTTPQGYIEFNPAGLTHGLALGTANTSQVNVPVLFVTGAAAGNNVGISTLVPPEKLSVAGNIRLIANGGALMFTDQGGGVPYMVPAVDGNFYFTGTTAAGAGRGIWRCAMRSDTSPFQIDVPLKIGAAGVAFKSVLKSTVTQTPNGGLLNPGVLYNVASTVTGALPGATIIVPQNANRPNIQIAADCFTADTVTVYYLNAGTSSYNIGTVVHDLLVFNT